jgi:hypothetical protein
VVITAVLVVTTGVAAAPFRDAWLPLVGHPLNLWSNGGAIRMPPTPAPLLVSRDLMTPQRMVDAPFIVAPERLDYRISQAGSSDDRRGESNRNDSAWSSQGASRSAGRSRASSGGGWSGGGGSGRFAGASFNSGRRSGSYNRDNSPSNSSGSRNSGSSSSSVSNRGGGGSSGKGGADDLFGEHDKGLGDLIGRGGDLSVQTINAPGKHGGGIASSPEPSSMLLFGTGIVAVAGALRRRMRR